MRIDDRVKRKGLVTMQHVDMAVASLKNSDSRVHYQKLSTFCPRKSKVCSNVTQWLRGMVDVIGIIFKMTDRGRK